MYGCIDGHVIFGFYNEDRDEMLSKKFLEDFGIEAYTIDVVRLYCGSFVYGIKCSFLNRKTGIPEIAQEDLDKVKKAFRVARKERVYQLGYIVGMSCYDLGFEHKQFDPRVRKERENMSDEENAGINIFEDEDFDESEVEEEEEEKVEAELDKTNIGTAVEEIEMERERVVAEENLMKKVKV